MKWQYSSSQWQGLEHVVTIVFKQAKDGPIAKALAAVALEEINDVLTLN